VKVYTFKADFLLKITLLRWSFWLYEKKVVNLHAKIEEILNNEKRCDKVFVRMEVSS
jgi:hypothetical protein